jgi:hypothetical protein
MSGRSVRTLRFLLVCLLIGTGGLAALAAHPLIDPDEADVIVRRIGELQQLDHPADAFELGEHITRIIDIANHDLRNSNGELSLLGRLLLDALHNYHIDPEYSDELERYRVYREPYLRYLQRVTDGSYQADARYRLLTADFYEGFRYNPLQPLQPDWTLLQQRITAIEDFLQDYAQFPQHEELQFIVAVYKTRAALEATDRSVAKMYGLEARQALQMFRDDYPDSMRAAAASTLLQSLPLP